MKICCKCRLSKDENEFFKDSSRKDGFANKCKKCDKTQHQKYIDEHPEYKEKQINKLKEWANNNKEKIPEISKKWRLENIDKINELKRLWRKNHPKENAAQQFKDGLKRKYNLTLEQYQAMIDKQENKCAICGHEMVDGRNTRYCRNIDHVHDELKKVRKILCNCCNKVIGYAYDDVKVLENAIKYLNSHSQKAII